MSDKDYIKELFQNELGNHQMKVDPQLWQGVQSQLGNIASTGAAGSTAVVGKASLFVKIGVAAALSTAAIVTTYVLVNSSDKPSEKTEIPNQSAILKEAQSIVESNESTISLENKIAENSSIEPSVNSEPSLNENIEGTSSSQTISNNSPNISSQPDEPTDNSTIPSTTNNEESNSYSNPSTPTEKDTPVPLELSIAFDKLSNQHYVFSAVSDDAERIVWDFGDGSTFSDSKAEHVYNESGTFTVTAYKYRKDEVVQETLSIMVDVVGKITNLPTLFTPNNDGSNDEFFIESEGLLDFSVVIMNDKGEILFESNMPDFRWDGRNRKTGLVADEGVYFYIITAKDELGNTISKHQRLQLKK